MSIQCAALLFLSLPTIAAPSAGAEQSRPLVRLPVDADMARSLQQSWAKQLNIQPTTTNSIGIKLTLIPGGRFDMGPNGSTYRVTLAKPFYIGVTEVSMGQYRRFKPGHRIEGADEEFNADDRPAAMVSWHDAKAFCTWLSDQPAEKKAGRVYALPTEVQWEWAARAGTKTTRYFGDTDKGQADYSWFNDTYTPNPKHESKGRGRQPVAKLKPNAFGLHDMLGNVWEWCADRRVDPATGETRDPVMRGGSWRSGAFHCTAVAHDPGDANVKADNIGFRVACSARFFEPGLKEDAGTADDMPFVRVAKDGRGFVNDAGKRFTPWGFNYDHDEKGTLLEDYWEADWNRVAEDFQEMKDLGANVVRIHLQLGKFMNAAARPNEKALQQLAKLVKLAETTRLYLDLTGLGCYHKKDVPAWYDELSEAERWAAQANFWRAVAKRCADSPAIFCYDLMNEPVVPGGKRKPGDWLGPPFAGSHFVQFITLDQAKRPRPDLARAWIGQLVAAIREHDRKHLVTVGLVDWSLDRPGLTSGFVPEKIAADLDFLCVHIYPKATKVDEALDTLKGFAATGKPVVIEETFPLQCSKEEFARFIGDSEKHAAGWIGFYWGKTPAELRRGNSIGDALMLQWLEYFERNAKKTKPQIEHR